MKDNIRNFIMKGFWVVIIVFIIRCLITKPASFYDCFSFAGESISITLILMGIYERWIWQFNPLEKVPNIRGEYIGNIEYNFNGKLDKKTIIVTIKQSLFSTNVRITTNEITSSTISSNIILENKEYVLYYIYITNPKSKYIKENPVQYGACKIIVKSKTELQGTYWTTQQTTGDIYLKKRG